MSHLATQVPRRGSHSGFGTCSAQVAAPPQIEGHPGGGSGGSTLTLRGMATTMF